MKQSEYKRLLSDYDTPYLSLLKVLGGQQIIDITGEINEDGAFRLVRFILDDGSVIYIEGEYGFPCVNHKHDAPALPPKRMKEIYKAQVKYDDDTP